MKSGEHLIALISSICFYQRDRQSPTLAINKQESLCHCTLVKGILLSVLLHTRIRQYNTNLTYPVVCSKNIKRLFKTQVLNGIFHVLKEALFKICMGGLGQILKIWSKQSILLFYGTQTQHPNGGNQQLYH